MKHFILVFIVITVVANALSFAPVRREYHHYVFFYEERDSILVNKLVHHVEQPLIDIERFLDLDADTTIHIHFTKSPKEYQREANMDIPEWSQAIAFTGSNTIIMNLATAEAIQQSPQILIHELFHIFLSIKYPEIRIPVWMNEGLAKYFSQDGLSFEDKRILANALSSRKIIYLNELENLIDFSPVKARLGYIEALSAVQFFIKHHGLVKIREVMDRYDKKNDLNLAFSQSVGYDFVHFEGLWYRDLKDRSRWLIFLNFDYVLWLSIGLLFISAIIFIRKRNRKKIREWDQNEFFEDIEAD